MEVVLIIIFVIGVSLFKFARSEEAAGKDSSFHTLVFLVTLFVTVVSIVHDWSEEQSDSPRSYSSAYSMTLRADTSALLTSYPRSQFSSNNSSAAYVPVVPRSQRNALLSSTPRPRYTSTPRPTATPSRTPTPTQIGAGLRRLSSNSSLTRRFTIRDIETYAYDYREGEVLTFRIVQPRDLPPSVIITSLEGEAFLQVYEPEREDVFELCGFQLPHSGLYTFTFEAEYNGYYTVEFDRGNTCSDE